MLSLIPLAIISKTTNASVANRIDNPSNDPKLVSVNFNKNEVHFNFSNNEIIKVSKESLSHLTETRNGTNLQGRINVFTENRDIIIQDQSNITYHTDIRELRECARNSDIIGTTTDIRATTILKN
jgi:hypothetical protein